jgi:hypothetical protein
VVAILYPEGVTSGFRLAGMTLLACAGALLAQPPSPIETYLKHPGFHWKCAQQRHFRFCWEKALDRDQDLIAARNSAEAARDTVLLDAAIPNYEPIIHVFFVASPERMEALIGYHGEGRSRPLQHAIFFVPTPIRPNLTHELCHEILTNVWGVAEAWVEEGYASLLAERRAVGLTCLSMSARHAMIPLSELVRPEWNPAIYSPDITYPELAGFLQFLTRTYGLPKVREIWRSGSESIPRITGKTVVALERDWHQELEHQTASYSVPPA